RDSFPGSPVRRLGLMAGNEELHLAVLEAPDSDAFTPAWMAFGIRFGVDGIEHVVLVDDHPARAAEVLEFTEELAVVLVDDLNAMVRPVGNDQPPLGVEH